MRPPRRHRVGLDYFYYVLSIYTCAPSRVHTVDPLDSRVILYCTL